MSEKHVLETQCPSAADEQTEARSDLSRAVGGREIKSSNDVFLDALEEATQTQLRWLRESTFSRLSNHRQQVLCRSVLLLIDDIRTLLAPPQPSTARPPDGGRASNTSKPDQSGDGQ